MKCINCGAEIKTEFNICPYCGKSLQMVPDYSIYDEEDINVIIEGAKELEIKKSKGLSKKEREQREKEKQKALELMKQKKTKMTIVITAVACVLLLVFGVVAKVIIDNVNENSFDYQMKIADSAMFKGDIDSAEKYYLKALSLEADNVSVRLELADLYLKKDNESEAIRLLMEAVKLEPTNTSAFGMLLDIYEDNDDLDSILALKKDVTDEKVLNLFSKYIVEAPSSNLPGGTYSDNVKLKLFAKKGFEIYYTLDGSNPKTNGTLYKNAFEIIGDGMHTLKIVAKNSLGVYSEVITETFVISYEAPADPVVTPDGGTFYAPTYVYISVPEGCTAYYTWDRTAPTIFSSMYLSPILIPEGYNVLSVIIVDNETGLSSGIYRGMFEYITD